MNYNVINNNIDSDDDEEILLYVVRPRKPKVFKTRRDYFTELDDEQFFCRFRLTKTTVLVLLNCIENKIKSATERYVYS